MAAVLREERQVARGEFERLVAAGEPQPARAFGQEMKEHHVLGARGRSRMFGYPNRACTHQGAVKGVHEHGTFEPH
jgi:hypothetical protein